MVDARIRISYFEVKAISEYPKPTTAPHLAQFLGMAKHIADVIPRFAELAAPLNEATKGLDIRKRSQRPPALNWTNECEQAFQKIKDAMISPPTLKVADITKPYIVQPDASDIAVGAVLLQEHDGKLHSVAYISKKWTEQERKWPIGEREAFAFVYAMKKWEHYLFGAKVTIEGDHKPLIALRTTKNPTRKQAAWLEFLESFDYIYEHIKGEKNVLGDALSRMYAKDTPVRSLSYILAAEVLANPAKYESGKEEEATALRQLAKTFLIWRQHFRQQECRRYMRKTTTQRRKRYFGVRTMCLSKM